MVKVHPISNDGFQPATPPSPLKYNIAMVAIIFMDVVVEIGVDIAFWVMVLRMDPHELQLHKCPPPPLWLPSFYTIWTFVFHPIIIAGSINLGRQGAVVDASSSKKYRKNIGWFIAGVSLTSTLFWGIPYLVMSWFTDNRKVEQAGCYPKEFEVMLVFAAIWSWVFTYFFTIVVMQISLRKAFVCGTA